MKLREIPEQTPLDGVDEEILKIFVEEVREVLAEITTAFKAWQEEPTDDVSLKNLRRAFEILNGSGRLVGATVIGELGWQFENMLDRIIDGTMLRNDMMLELIVQAEGILPTLLEQFQNGQPTQRDVIVLISQVHHFTKTRGQELGDFEEEESSIHEVELEDSTPIENLETAQEQGTDTHDEFMAIFFDEAEEILENTQFLLERWQSAPQSMQLVRELQRELHTLKGGAKMVSIEPMAELSQHLEELLTQIGEGTLKPNPKLQKIVRNSVNELVVMLEAVRTGTSLEIPHELINQISEIQLMNQTNEISSLSFARISPRLRRKVRLMAREYRKNVEFTINGEDTVFEPAVLNNLAFPLEQLLGNVVQYGIEDAETRHQAGKPATAQITIDVVREGAELIIKISDDGRELDLPEIRRKAVARGMIKPGVIVSDQELVQLIFGTIHSS